MDKPEAKQIDFTSWRFGKEEITDLLEKRRIWNEVVNSNKDGKTHTPIDQPPTDNNYRPAG